jgi:hypothetical protein
MAPLAGLLIEYFIVGIVASLWFVPLVIRLLSHPGLDKDVASVAAAIFVPAIYVVGMICDYLGYWATYLMKKKLESKAREKGGVKKFSSRHVHAYAVAYEPKLAREMDAPKHPRPDLPGRTDSEFSFTCLLATWVQSLVVWRAFRSGGDCDPRTDLGASTGLIQ